MTPHHTKTKAHTKTRERESMSLKAFIMVFSSVFLVLLLIAASVSTADGALSWGAFLGADWRTGEGK